VSDPGAPVHREPTLAVASDATGSTADPHAVPLLDAAAARRGDRAAVEAGDTWLELMQRASGHLARGVLRLAGRSYGLRVAIVVGKGDNGGDGWTAAPRLTAAGAQVRVVAVDGTDVEVSAATAAGRAAWLDAGGWTATGTDRLPDVLDWCDVAVDCLLGTGAQGAPRGPAGEAAAALRAAHGRGTPVVACDVPSGVGADDGTAGDGAVVADLTVTFGARKRGLLLHPGAQHAGEVVVGDLGPRYDPGPTAWSALTPTGARPPAYTAATDKVARGRVLVVAGGVGTSGAAALAAEGALRAGAGLVTAVVPDPVRTEVATRTDPGVMVRGVPADDEGAVAGAEGLPDLDGFDVVTAGPGLGYGEGASVLVAYLRAHAPRLVLDADALNVHRDDPDELADHTGELVLTPHERELARIGAGQDGPDAWANRVERVPALASRYHATIVAKGPGTLVAAPDGRVWVCPTGGPALGSGGTGDALAGIVGAAIARADDVPLAVARAVWWHAVAGHRAGLGRAGRATATDLLRELPGVLGDLLDGEPGHVTSRWSRHGGRRP
jgi:ADP-dependent NAD(P)H-hydrate dehydratase / NAD(P)H-hydrate epimerase